MQAKGHFAELDAMVILIQPMEMSFVSGLDH